MQAFYDNRLLCSLLFVGVGGNSRAALWNLRADYEKRRSPQEDCNHD
jgi:hypothetical protein